MELGESNRDNITQPPPEDGAQSSLPHCYLYTIQFGPVNWIHF